MDLGFGGASVVVQGGTGGMGRAAAECLAREGARVAVLARSKERIDETVAALRELGSPDAVGYPVDVTDDFGVRTVFLAIEKRWGELNALINMVGPEVVGNFEELTDDQWMSALNQGAMGMVRCVRSAIPLLRRAEWARIVNVSARSTKAQTAPLVAYTAAKSVVTSVSKNLSLSLAPDEILVNTISPGSFATPALQGWASSVGVDPSDPYAIMSAIADHFGHPAHLPRAGRPEEIGPVVAFLASRCNSYMTGADVNVDGGSDFT
jgi:3-oxoacyl-[acyl-carrier protein] reductase